MTDIEDIMTVAEAVAWADDAIDREDSADWYGKVYSTCDAVMDDAQSNQGLNAETVIRTQSGEDAACAGEGRFSRAVMALMSGHLFSACPVVFDNENYGVSIIDARDDETAEDRQAINQAIAAVMYGVPEKAYPGAILSERYEDLINKD